MKYFRLIWKNVFRKKLRTTLTALRTWPPACIPACGTTPVCCWAT